MIIFKSVLALSVIILVGRYLLRPILHIIASQKHEDLFISNYYFICGSWGGMAN